MILYVIRHGQTEYESSTGRDRDRTLLDHGINQAKALAQYLASPKAQTPITVLASPYIRAQQTAAPIWSTLNQQNQTDDRLAANRCVSDVLDAIADTAGNLANSPANSPAVAIIGHNPILSRLVDVLIEGPSAPHQYTMQPGQLIGLDIDPINPLGSAKLIIQVRLDD